MRSPLQAVVGVAVAAGAAWLLVAIGAPWFDYWGWLAVMLACGLVNALTISPRHTGDVGPEPHVPFVISPYTRAQHAPRLERLREPAVLLHLVILATVLVWLVIRAHAS